MRTQKFLKLILSASVTAGMVMSVTPAFADEIEASTEDFEEEVEYDIVPEENEEAEAVETINEADSEEIEEEYQITPFSLNDKDICEVMDADGEYHGYETIHDAIHWASDEKETTIILLSDVEENIVIPEEKVIILDLNGFTLSGNDTENEEVQTGDYPAVIVNEGTLTITGDGTVDAVTDGYATLSNDSGAACTIENGTFIRSLEGEDNSYYTICNQGLMVIEDGVFENYGTTHSIIMNGFTDGEEQDEDAILASLTINGGSFAGGLYNIENNDYGLLTINDGSFIASEDTDGGCILVKNNTAIHGGTFCADDAVFAVAAEDAIMADGKLSIDGGTFVSTNEIIFKPAYEDADMSGISVSGGTFVNSEGERISISDYLKNSYGQNKEGEVVLNSELIVSVVTWESDEPGSIVIRLFGNGEEIMAEIVNIENGSTPIEMGPYEILDENGDEIEYTVSIDDIDGYEITQDGFDFTISPIITEVQIAGTIFWTSDIFDGEVTLHLFANDEEIDSIDVIGEDSEWLYDFGTFDRYDEDGEEIEYTVTMDDIDGFTITQDGSDFIVDSDDSDYNYVIMNGTVTWDSTIAESAKINTYADGEWVSSLVLGPSYASENDEHVWEFTVIGDKYDDDGNEIEYNLTMDDIAGYTIVQDGYNFTVFADEEVERIEVGGTITWTDGTPLAGTIRLYANGEEYQVSDFTAEDAVDSYAFTNLPEYDDDGNEIEYTVSMDEIEGYEIIQDGFDFTVTKLSDEDTNKPDTQNEPDSGDKNGDNDGSDTDNSNDGTDTTTDTNTGTTTESSEPETVTTVTTETVPSDVAGTTSASTSDTRVVPITVTIIALAAAAAVFTVFMRRRNAS